MKKTWSISLRFWKGLRLMYFNWGSRSSKVLQTCSYFILIDEEGPKCDLKLKLFFENYRSVHIFIFGKFRLFSLDQFYIAWLLKELPLRQTSNSFKSTSHKKKLHGSQDFTLKKSISYNKYDIKAKTIISLLFANHLCWSCPFENKSGVCVRCSMA